MAQYCLLPSLLYSSSKLEEERGRRGKGRGEEEESPHLSLESTFLIKVYFHV